MANEEYLKILKEGPEAWNQWRWENREVGVPDLSEADLRGARLAWADLSGVDLFKADLSAANLEDADVRGARLHQADLRRARLGGTDLSIANLREAVLNGADLSRAYIRASILSRADLRDAQLIFANLSDADLSEANLRGADLANVNLSNSNLSGADFSQAVLDGTRFGDNDLSQVKGLEAVQHNGPSTIGIDTVYLSKGNIPDEFLRGAGVPEAFIANMKALVAAMEPIQFYSCFISYSSKDEEFSRQLYDSLRGEHVRCWRFAEDAKWGNPIWEEIERPIRKYDKVVVICSHNSLNSGPVLREIERALQREDREKRSVLFPIRIDDYVFEGWEHPRKPDVLSKVIGDFREWKERDKYKAAFERLMRDLKSSGG